MPGKGQDRLGVFMPLISGVVLVVVGYLVTGRVETALKSREIETATAREMREILVKIYTPGISHADAEASALTLTAFGPSAVGPLVRLLDTGSLQSVAAENALRALAVTDPGPVCAAVARIVGNRTGMFSLAAHLAAIRLAGVLACRDARAPLADYRKRVGQGSLDEGLPGLLEIVGGPAPTKENLVDVRSELERSLRHLPAEGSP